MCSKLYKEPIHGEMNTFNTIQLGCTKHLHACIFSSSKHLLKCFDKKMSTNRYSVM